MSVAAGLQAVAAKSQASRHFYSGRSDKCRSHVLQRKLAIGATSDPLEREADRVADQVLAKPAASIITDSPPRIQRLTKGANGQEDAVQADGVHAAVDHVIASPGRPLGTALREDMERRFGYDFSRVRVHLGEASELSARDVNADAYTVGSHVAFAAGQFEPGTHEGRRLIAHELTHVVQQASASEFRADPSNSKDGRTRSLRTARITTSGVAPAVPDCTVVQRKPQKERGPTVSEHTPAVIPETQLIEVMNQRVAPGDEDVREIEIQGVLLYADFDVYAALRARLSLEPPPATDKLAVTFQRAFSPAARRRLLSYFIARSGEADVWEGLAPGRKTEKVDLLGRIDAPKGVYLRSKPFGSTDGPLLPFDTLVTIERKTIEKKSEKSWFYVVAVGDDSGGRNATGAGFVEEYFVAPKPPEPTAHLYLVQRGDKLKDIAARYYKHGFAWGHDARVFVQAIYHANKERDVVFRQNADLSVDRRALETDNLDEALELWKEARVVEGQALWVPSFAFVDKLKAAGLINNASISLHLWEATIGAVIGGIQALIDWAQYTAGFVIGLLKGAWGALSDLFTGIVDLIKALWSVVKAFFGDYGDILAFAKKLSELWKNRELILETIATDFTNKWTAADDYDRGNFQGEFLGYVMMVAFITLVTFGAGVVITGAGRFGAFIRLIEVMSNAGDFMFYVSKLKATAKLPGTVVDKARDALKGRAPKTLETASPAPAPASPITHSQPAAAPETRAASLEAESPRRTPAAPTAKEPGMPQDQREWLEREAKAAEETVNQAANRARYARGRATKLDRAGDPKGAALERDRAAVLERDAAKAREDAETARDMLSHSTRAEAKAASLSRQGKLQQEIDRLATEERAILGGKVEPPTASAEGKRLHEIRSERRTYERRLAEEIEAATGLTTQVQAELRKGTPFGGPGGAERERAFLDSLPAQAKGPSGTYADYITGELRPRVELHPDHIVSVDEIFRMKGFGDLPRTAQREILDLPANLRFLDKGLNLSKRHQSLSTWLSGTAELVPKNLTMARRKALGELEDKARAAVKAEIDRRLAAMWKP